MRQSYLLKARQSFQTPSIKKQPKTRNNTFEIRHKHIHFNTQSSSQRKPLKDNPIRLKTDLTLLKQRSTIITQFYKKDQSIQPLNFRQSLTTNGTKQTLKDSFFMINLLKQFQTQKYKYKFNPLFNDNEGKINNTNNNKQQFKRSNGDGVGRHKLQLTQIKKQQPSKQQCKITRKSFYYQRLQGGRRQYLKKRMKMLLNTSQSPIDI